MRIRVCYCVQRTVLALITLQNYVQVSRVEALTLASRCSELPGPGDVPHPGRGTGEIIVPGPANENRIIHG